MKKIKLFDAKYKLFDTKFNLFDILFILSLLTQDARSTNIIPLSLNKCFILVLLVLLVIHYIKNKINIKISKKSIYVIIYSIALTLITGFDLDVGVNIAFFLLQLIAFVLYLNLYQEKNLEKKLVSVIYSSAIIISPRFITPSNIKRSSSFESAKTAKVIISAG